MTVQYLVYIAVIQIVIIPVTAERHVAISKVCEICGHSSVESSSSYILNCQMLQTREESSPCLSKKSDKCFLLPSELGPDWYKVPRPTMAGKNGRDISYMHMPCATTTVFDVGICGCTNLMSYLYESMKRGKNGPKVQTTKGKIKKHDAVKHEVEWEGEKSGQQNAGSLLINVRTGEIKNCPFRASPRGSRWYLIRDPGEHWIPMICADGTVYDTIKCTCVHIATVNKKPGDEDVFVIEEDFANVNKDNTISRSLGISVSDIDFAPKKKNNDIPFWRREEKSQSKENHAQSRFNGKSDVKVTLDERSKQKPSKVRKRIFDPASKDVISDAHSNLLIRLRPRPVASSNPMISAFDLNPPSLIKDSGGISNSVNHTLNAEVRKRDNPIRKERPETQRGNTDIFHVIDKINSQIIRLENVGNDDLIYDERKSIEIQTPAGATDEIIVDKIKDGQEPDIYDEIFYQEECSKKPIPELGPQYFLYFVMDLGFVPYTCHGNSIYDDSMCACMPSPEDTSFDEVKFPEEECSKKPIPEMGPQFFEDFLFGIGYIPFVCHGDKFYDNAECACI